MGKKLIRLQVEIEPEHMEELEELQVLGGLRTKKDLWNNAITLLKWAAREEARGASICSINEEEGTFKELELPFLQTYASNVRRKLRRDNPDPDPRPAEGRGNALRDTAATVKKHLARAAAA